VPEVQAKEQPAVIGKGQKARRDPGTSRLAACTKRCASLPQWKRG